MKTIGTGEFTRHFSRHRREPCVVKDGSEVLGTWTPLAAKPKVVDFLSRARKDFKQKLPFTGADVLKASNAR